VSRFTEATYEVIPSRFKGGRPMVRLTSPMRFDVVFLGSPWPVEAGAGYCTDLASVPVLPPEWLRHEGRWGQFWRWVDRRRTWVADRLARSSVPHDVMREDRRWPKWITDLVFIEAMWVDRVPLWLIILAGLMALLNFSRH